MLKSASCSKRREEKEFTCCMAEMADYKDPFRQVLGKKSQGRWLLAVEDRPDESQNIEILASAFDAAELAHLAALLRRSRRIEAFAR